MKKFFRLSVMVAVVVVMLFGIFATACSGGKEHVCEHVCPICGLCTDPDCDDPACAEKCQGHEAPQHECESVCPVCGGCLDMECEEEACAEKCGAERVNSTEYPVSDIRVGKTNVDIDVAGVTSGFNLANGGGLTYEFYVAEDSTVTLAVIVRSTTEAAVYTDYVNVMVNGEKLDRPTTVPAVVNALTAQWSEINLGCIELKAGNNTITFAANGNGLNSWAFECVKLYYDGMVDFDQAAIEVAHDCESVCEVCGGCTDFSCYNIGCANKCECVTQSKGAAQMYWALDRRAFANVSVNDQGDGLGCSWNSTTTVEFNVTADKAGTVEYGAVISTDVPEVLFTDQFVVTVNGTQVEPGTGKCPVGEAREWNTYAFVDVGYLNLQEGRNTIVVSQTPKHASDGGTEAAFNFQSFIIFSDEVSTEWFYHRCESKCEFCGGCQDLECTEKSCSAKCYGHVNEEADYCGYDLNISKKGNHKIQPQTLYNFEKLNLIKGKQIIIDDDTEKAINGEALGVGSKIRVNFTLNDKANMVLRPVFTPIVVPEGGFSIDGIIKFTVDGYVISDYVVQKASQGAWMSGWKYINIGLGSWNMSAGEHTLEIEIIGENAPSINEIRFNAHSYGSWTPEDYPAVHMCSKVCPKCGGCLDAECTDPACATKCSCGATDGTETPATEAVTTAQSYIKPAIIECGYCKVDTGILPVLMPRRDLIATFRW